MSTQHFLYWLPMILIAIINGTIRQWLFTKYFSELRAHQLSTISLIILCAVYVWAIFPRLHIADAKQALIVGAVWMLLTVIFEFSMGLAAKRSWSYMLKDYDLLAGHLWPIFLLALLLMPYIFLMAGRKA